MRRHITLAPAAPSEQRALALSSSQVKLTWRDISTNEIGFRIERQSPYGSNPDGYPGGSGSSWTEIAVVGANATVFTETGRAPGTAYQYRVRAYNTSGYLAYSKTVYVTTPR